MVTLKALRRLSFSARTLGEKACHSLSFGRCGKPADAEMGNSRDGVNRR
jgi:hypothetical protein